MSQLVKNCQDKSERKIDQISRDPYALQGPDKKKAKLSSTLNQANSSNFKSHKN